MKNIVNKGIPRFQMPVLRTIKWIRTGPPTRMTAGNGPAAGRRRRTPPHRTSILSARADQGLSRSALQHRHGGPPALVTGTTVTDSQAQANSGVHFKLFGVSPGRGCGVLQCVPSCGSPECHSALLKPSSRTILDRCLQSVKSAESSQASRLKLLLTGPHRAPPTASQAGRPGQASDRPAVG